MTDFASPTGYFVLSLLAVGGAFLVICALHCKLTEWFSILQSHERNTHPLYLPVTDPQTIADSVRDRWNKDHVASVQARMEGR